MSTHLTITDLIADISIMTSDTTATEGGAIALTIASSIPVPAALTNGLEVIIDIVGADPTDFAPGVCINLPRCDVVVVIPSGMDSIELILMPLTGDESESQERWTATIRPVAALCSTFLPAPAIATFDYQQFSLSGKFADPLNACGNLNAYDSPDHFSGG